MVNASRRRAACRATASTASATFDPAMNFRAIRSAFGRACHASSRPSEPALRDEPRRPAAPTTGSSSPASARYSRRCRLTSLGSLQVRQRVDEAEELDLEGRVVHRQAHEPVVEPGAA